MSLLFLTGDTDQNKPWFVTSGAYYSPPKEGLPGFPGAVKDKPKTGRARWKLPDGGIGEWDYEKGEVEVYDKTGNKHKGGFDPKTGKQRSPAKPGRKTQK